MKLYLAVGHGRRPDGRYDPGAVGGGWSEQTAGDIIVAEAARMLQTWGHVVYEESDQDDPNFYGSTSNANSWGADLVVAIHHDWVRAPVGAFGHWYTSEGKELADAIQKCVGAAGFPLRNEWHKRRTDLYILKHTDAPATVLYEVGRIGQTDLNEREELEFMGRAVANGIQVYIDRKEPREERMTEEQDKLLKDVHEIVSRLANSARASSFREAIMVAIAMGNMEEADRLDEEARGKGIVTGYSRPQ